MNIFYLNSQMDVTRPDSPVTTPIVDAPEVVPAVTSPADAADAATNVQLNAELLELAKKYRILIPFLVLLLLKLILDNSMPFLFISFATYGIIRIRSQLELQISLKNKTNTTAFLYLWSVSFALLSLIMSGIRISGIPDNLTDRLLLIYGSEKNKPIPSFLHTLWCCVIVDCLIQVITLLIKCTACLCIGTQAFQCSSLLNLSKPEFWRDVIRMRLPSTASTVVHHHNNDDIENQRATTENNNNTNGALTQDLLNQLLTSFGSQSNLSNGIIGLARRTNSGIPSNTNTPTTTTTTSNNNHRQSHAYATVNDHDSDTAHDPQESMEYLKRMRLCALIDIVSFGYRTAVPIGPWVDYFGSGGVGAFVLPVVYCTVKLFDMMWKGQAVFDAVKNYYYQILEYGHYSTPEEYPSPTTTMTPATSSSSLSHLKECPVCFDTPISRPVTLDCHHIFCEICILEWLAKEKTCPICRAEVKCVSPLIGSIKEEICNSSFIVT